MVMTPVKTFLDPDLAQSVTRLAAAQGRSESAVVAEAVRARFAEEAAPSSKASGETMKRQLNRLEGRIDKLLWEQQQLKESLFLFVRVWLEHNPPIPDDIEESAAASAAARFERFLDLIANGLTSGHPLGDLGALLDAAPEGNGALQPAEARP
jgi:hypothetical protein